MIGKDKNFPKIAEILFEAVTDGIITVNKDSKIMSCNHAVEKIFGYRPDELIGVSLNILLPAYYLHYDEEIKDYIKHYAPKVIEKGREIEGVHKNGSTIPLEVIICKIKIGEDFVLSAVIKDLSELKQTEEKLTFMALHDQLTKLVNRKYFEERLKRSLYRGKRYGYRFVIMFLDLNKFKKVNDTYGHDVGDKVLKRVAELLKPLFRTTDIIARIGGDEFMVLLEEVKDKEACAIIANRIIEAVGKSFDIEGHKINIGISIGIALFPGDGDDEASIMKHSDQAMYAAKKEGVSSYKFFDSIRAK